MKPPNTIRCAFCSWTRPRWRGRKNGYSALHQHVLEHHPGEAARTLEHLKPHEREALRQEAEWKEQQQP
jgi:hypothetical protein